jgi:TrmH family RNA methyltransferase
MTNIELKLSKEIKKLQTHHGRKKSTYYIIEGVRCCQEALLRLNSDNIVSIITTNEYDGELDNNKHHISNIREFKELSQTQNSQGIIVVAKKPTHHKINFKDDFLLVLDRIQDPGNMGTILRTAIAVGITEIALIKGCVDPYNPKSIRSGMGAQFILNFEYFDDLSTLCANKSIKDRKVWLTTPHEGVSCYDPEFNLQNSILVFGEEANGICDFTVGTKTMIPTLSDIESLNVAQAATVYLFEGLRQKVSKS